MLLAAGKATRLAPFSDVVPKALMPVMGIPCAQFVMDWLARAGANHMVANVYHLSSMCAQGLLALDRHGEVDLVISDESNQLLWTGGGIRYAMPLLGWNRFVVAAADRLMDLDIQKLFARHDELHHKFGVRITLAVCTEKTAAQYREITLDTRGERITSVGEKTIGKPYYLGVAVIEPEALAHLHAGMPADFVTEILNPTIQAGKVGAFVTSCRWLDIDSPALWSLAHFDLMSLLESGTCPPPWKDRITSLNQLLRPSVWTWSGVTSLECSKKWTGPCYWKGESKPPAVFGPNAVATDFSGSAEGLTKQCAFSRFMLPL